MKKTKRSKKISEIISDLNKRYSLKEGIEILKQCPKLKFDQTVEVAVKLGVDPKKSDQQVRSVAYLPYGTGKKQKVLVFAKADKAKEALDAKADYAGAEEYIEKVKNGWMDFSAVIATPDMMRDVAKLGKILGPRSLMPTPKAGTVTTDVAKAVKDLKSGGKIDFKIDKNAIINTIIGKISFDVDKLIENFKTLISAVNKAKPSSSKGVYIRNVVVSMSMGPGIKIDLQTLNG